MRFPKHKTPKSKNRDAMSFRSPSLESLENRCLMATLPYGAMTNDTGEYFLGRIAVTPVLLESTGQTDSSTEDWNSAHISQVLANVQQGLEWWNDLLDTKTSIHNLDFVVDDQYALTPSPTIYEPINRVSNDYALWVPEFLNRVGYNQFNSVDDNMRAFNHAQRLKHNADWAFTIFVVNSQNEQDGTFASGGSFSRAFAFAGGLYFIVPSTRPASTFAHETGHMFWARDEYSGGGNYTQRRGYYNTQNLNAIDLNPTPNFQQETSIMSAGNVLQNAYDQVVSPASTLAMVGWQDSDGDGVFDVLDVPLSLDGVGRHDASGVYKFRGSAKVNTLPNLNSSGLQNDITLNRINRVEYRVNNGTWITVEQPNTYEANLNLDLPIAANQTGTVSIRVVDNTTGMTSNVFEGSLGATYDATSIVGIQGFVWSDLNQNIAWDGGEKTQAGWQVQLVNASGQPLNLQTAIEPDGRGTGVVSSGAFPGAVLSAIGLDSDGSLGIFVDTNASTGTQVFRPYSTLSQEFIPTWRGLEHQLRVDFTNPTTFVSVDVIGSGTSSFGRLEIYDAQNNLLGRTTSSQLANGAFQKLRLGSDQVNIAYAIVRAHARTSIKIDNLKYGAENTTTTDAGGRYAFRNLPPGEYRVKVLGRPNFSLTTADTQTVTLGVGQNVDHVDFGASFNGSKWHNFNLAQDTNDDGLVSPLDALLIINQLNLIGSKSLPGSGIATTPFIDVSNDESMTPLDALLVINFLNLQSVGGEGETGTANGGSSGNSGGEPEGEQVTRADAGAQEIFAVWGRYENAIGPTTESQEWVERLTLPTWSLSQPCNCAYCRSIG